MKTDRKTIKEAQKCRAIGACETKPKNGRATIAGEPASEALNWFETPSAMSSAYS
jgi:hypothetical protein